MREPKSITAGIQRRGWWDAIGDRGNERELEIEAIEDLVMDGSELVKLKLGGLCSEPLNESDFVIVEIGLLKDVKVPLHEPAGSKCDQ